MPQHIEDMIGTLADEQAGLASIPGRFSPAIVRAAYRGLAPAARLLGVELSPPEDLPREKLDVLPPDLGGVVSALYKAMRDAHEEDVIDDAPGKLPENDDELAEFVHAASAIARTSAFRRWLRARPDEAEEKPDEEEQRPEDGETPKDGAAPGAPANPFLPFLE